MSNPLSSKSAKPRLRSLLPGYPTLAAGLFLCLSTGCGSGQTSDETDPPSAGGIAAPYDAAPPPQDTAPEFPVAAGIVAPPYDASPNPNTGSTDPLPGDPAEIP